MKYIQKLIFFVFFAYPTLALEYYLTDENRVYINDPKVFWQNYEKDILQIQVKKDSWVFFRHLKKKGALFISHNATCKPALGDKNSHEGIKETYPTWFTELWTSLPEENGDYFIVSCYVPRGVLRLFRAIEGNPREILKQEYQDFFYRLVLYGFYIVFGFYLLILSFFPDKNRSFFIWAGSTLTFLGFFLFVRRNSILPFLFPFPFLWGYFFYFSVFGAIISSLGFASVLSPNTKRIYYQVQQIYYFLFFIFLVASSLIGIFHPEGIIKYFYYSFFVSVFFIVGGLILELKKRPVFEIALLMFSLGLLGLLTTLDLTLYLFQIDTSFSRLKWGLNLFGLNIAIVISLWYYRNLRLREKTMHLLEKKVAIRTKKLEESLELLESSLKVASEIQQKLLPEKEIFQDIPCEVEVWYEPKLSVGGDIFQIHQRSQTLRIFLADTTGHDVASAMVTMLLYVEYEHLLKLNLPCGELLRELNSAFVNKYSKLKTYFSALVLDIDFSKSQIQYAMGGHPEQILIKESHSEILLNTGPILGFRLRGPWEEKTLFFEKGDILMLFSDGLLENSQDIRNPIDLRDLETLIRLNKKNSPKEIMDNLKREIKKINGYLPPADDLVVLLLKF